MRVRDETRARVRSTETPLLTTTMISEQAIHTTGNWFSE